MLKIFELEKMLRDFTKTHGLILETSYHHLGPGDAFMDYLVTNPETCEYRELRVYEYYLNNVENAYKSIIDYLLEQGIVKCFDKKKLYITTARGAGKSEIQRRLEEELCGGYDIEFLHKKFNIPSSIDFYNDEIWKKTREKMMKPTIEKVYFNAPYTIVIWSDKTKTMVKAENEAYDEEKGLAMAICKKFLGTNENKSNYFDEFKKWLPKIEGGPVKEEKKVPIGKVKAVVTDPEGGISITVETPAILTPAQFAAIAGRSVSTIRRECAQGLHPGAKLVNGRWQIPYSGMAKKGE